MRKINGFSLVFVIVLALLVSFTGSVSAETQAAACPAGLICTPIANVVSKDCPAGLVCVIDPSYVKPIMSSNSTTACYRFSTNLGYKGINESVSMGTDVANLQNLLISKGFDIPSITKSNTPSGSFDEDTRDAVMKYQKSKGIPTTGFVGQLTRGSLNTLCLSDTPGSSYIKVLSPNGDETLVSGQKFNVKVKIPSDKQYIIAFYYIPKSGTPIRTGDGTAFDYSIGGYSGGSSWQNYLSSSFDNQLILPADLPSGSYKLKAYLVNTSNVDDYPIYRNAISSDESDYFFTIKSSLTPSATPLASPSTSATPMIYSINPSRGGLDTKITIEGANFSGVTSLNLYATDGRWVGTLVPSAVSEKKLTVSFSRAFAANSGSGVYQLSIDSSKCGNGCNRVSYTLDNSGSTPTPTPTPAQTPSQPRVSFTSPVGSETWYVGETKTVSWSYANFESNVSGDKWVDLMLQPMDGREPVKLATYTAPYTSTPLKIYTKTTDGRNAWLPGQYKLKLVCRNTNIEGFRSCAEAIPGYITVVQSTPTPTPTSGATIMQNYSGAELNASIWSAVEDYLKTR